MKNTLELQLRALRPPRVLKINDAGVPQFLDVWAMHHSDRSPNRWAIVVKFGHEMAAQATAIQTGTLFTVKGRIDQNKNPKTGLYHTFIWAEEVFDLVPSRKNHAESSALETPELDFPEAAQDDEIPASEVPRA